MATFIHGSVYVVGFLAVLVLAVAALMWLAQWFDERVVQRWEIRHEISGRNQLRDRLLRDAAWFTEDRATFELLQALANGEDPGRARDRWRQTRGYTVRVFDPVALRAGIKDVSKVQLVDEPGTGPQLVITVNR